MSVNNKNKEELLELLKILRQKYEENETNENYENMAKIKHTIFLISKELKEKKNEEELEKKRLIELENLNRKLVNEIMFLRESNQKNIKKQEISYISDDIIKSEKHKTKAFQKNGILKGKIQKNYKLKLFFRNLLMFIIVINVVYFTFLAPNIDKKLLTYSVVNYSEVNYNDMYYFLAQFSSIILFIFYTIYVFKGKLFKQSSLKKISSIMIFSGLLVQSIVYLTNLKYTLFVNDMNLFYIIMFLFGILIIMGIIAEFMSKYHIVETSEREITKARNIITRIYSVIMIIYSIFFVLLYPILITNNDKNITSITHETKNTNISAMGMIIASILFIVTIIIFRKNKGLRYRNLFVIVMPMFFVFQFINLGILQIFNIDFRKLVPNIFATSWFVLILFIIAMFIIIKSFWIKDKKKKNKVSKKTNKKIKTNNGKSSKVKIDKKSNKKNKNKSEIKRRSQIKINNTNKNNNLTR